MRPMNTPEEYRERAADCDRLALEARRPHDREAMQYAAQRWRDMAEEEESKARQRPRTGS
jgi:hypothetical protein